MSASAIIADVRTLLRGSPVFLTGSLVAEEAYGKSNAHSDVDLFCPTQQQLISTTQFLMCHGYTVDDRFKRVWARWLKYGMKNWHTNSMRLESPSGHETNLVYKLADGHATTSLAQVIESFDFGLLAMGYDLETDTYRDMRSYLFPGMDPDGPLPLMPNKRESWRNGFISRYNGLREFGRYAKYYDYGYDLSGVKDDLCTGYRSAADYLVPHHDAEKQQLGAIYEVIAETIERDDIAQLKQTTKMIDYDDPLDVIMDALE